MSKIRLLILALGPIPIVAISLALSNWLRSDALGPPGSNHFLVAHALGAEDEFGGTGGGTRESAAIDARLASGCQQIAKQLAPRLGDRCHTIVRPPLVIAGDMSADELDHWYLQTIGPAARAMARRYFRQAPDEPITVLLFSDEANYNLYAERLFGDHEVSIYGYYKPQQRTLVMNIGTGGGTLVHELTHALVAFDFPKIPDWFNEGLASLHEQCRFRLDASGPWIEGLENWRLPGLQKAIAAGRLRPLESLIEDDDFRGRHEGLNYAQARYFCLYLQREGLLETYYRRFRAGHADDPHGLQTVSALFPDTSWADVNQKFQTWVLSLERE